MILYKLCTILFKKLSTFGQPRRQGEPFLLFFPVFRVPESRGVAVDYCFYKKNSVKKITQKGKFKKSQETPYTNFIYKKLDFCVIKKKFKKNLKTHRFV